MKSPKLFVVAALAVVGLGAGLVNLTSAAPASMVNFPDCFANPIMVGTRTVYAGAPARCTATTTSPSTTSTSPASSTSSSLPVVSTTSSSAVPPTSAVPTTTVAAPPSEPGCGLAAAAFCETFDAPHNGGTQTGDLDPVLWGVSRVGDHNSGGGVFNAITPSHNACANTATAPAADVKVCAGQMVESVNDGGGVAQLNTYPKQPFNFAGRTGTITFDVSGDSGGTHAAWPEFAITDEPVPGVRRSISFQDPAHAVNQVGFALDGCTNNGSPDLTGVGVIFGSVNGSYFEQTGSRPDCVTKGSRTAMNRIKVEVSATHIRVSGTDAGSSVFKVLADDDVSLGFAQGLVWLDDVHYNARKGVEDATNNAIGTQFDHSFAWDNLGFDGPKTYRDLGFDVPLANSCCKSSINGDQEINEGYDVGGGTGPRTFTVNGIDWVQTPTKAKIVLNGYTESSGVTVQVSLNGKTVGSKSLDPYGVRSLAIDLPAADAVKGANSLRVQMVGGYGVVSNTSLILVAAAPVP